jgi:hypothetical protein
MKMWVNSQDAVDNPFDQPRSADLGNRKIHPFDQPRSADLGNRKISVASSVMPLDGQLHLQN